MNISLVFSTSKFFFKYNKYMNNNLLTTHGDIRKRLNIDWLLYREILKPGFYGLITRRLIIKQYKIESLLYKENLGPNTYGSITCELIIQLDNIKSLVNREKFKTKIYVLITCGHIIKLLKTVSWWKTNFFRKHFKLS